MVDLVDDMARNVEGGTFLEPACGTGNFLIEILERKCSALRACDKPKWQTAEVHAFRLSCLLSLLYGIDIMPDNVVECRRRLGEFVLAAFDAVVKGRDKGTRQMLETAADVITKINIVEGDALQYRTNDGKPIVFVKWRAGRVRDSYSFGVTPYYFDTMVDDEGKSTDLFEIKNPLERSAQFAFHEIRKVEEFMKGVTP